jgi:DNA topoisomerase-1
LSDDTPGIRRVKRGQGFAYRRPDGGWLTNEAELDRIRRLAIPPAYTDVWIAPRADAHLQATGRDARGRKQYRYHPEWRAARDAGKFVHMLDFGRALPRIRRRVAADLAAAQGAPRRQGVLAALVRLLDTTLVRVGNDEYARQNGSYGLTTLRDRHAQVQGSVLQLRFRGKSGVMHEVGVNDPRVARIVRRCQALPGQELFQYQDDDGEVRSLGSADVNEYLRECAGIDLTAKDFRTWHATVHALDLMCSHCRKGGPVSARTVNEVLGEVSSRLGNTVAVCRKSYVHPDVLDAPALAQALDELDRSGQKVPVRGLGADERRLLAFLARSLRAARATAKSRAPSSSQRGQRAGRAALPA